MAIQDQRKKVFFKMQELKSQPRRNLREEAELKALEKEWERLKLCGDKRKVNA